ncbi:MAG: glycosyltransferase [Verrucomicrobiales bacterium]
MKPRAENSPFVSVVIPTLALDKAVSATLGSIPGNLGAEVEILVQHGGKKPDTPDGMDLMPPSTRIESLPDNGVYYGINRAISRAKGKYVLVLGAGDTLRRGVLEEVLPHLREAPPLDAVYGDVWMMESKTRYFGEFKPQDFFRYNVCQQALFYRRELVIDMGGFKTMYPVLSDYEFNVRFFSRPEARIRYIPVVVCNYLGDGLSSHKWKDDPWIAERQESVARAFGITKTKDRKKRANIK